MADGRESLARELADTEATRVAAALRKRMLAHGATEVEADDASQEEFLRVYEEVFAQAMAGGS